MESRGWRFIIDLHTQMVGEEAGSFDSEREDKCKKKMELNEEGVLRLEGGSKDDDLDLVNGLFHWQMEDYELFLSYNMLRVDEGEKRKKKECPKEYREAKEGKVITTKAKGKNILHEPKKRKDFTVRYTMNGLCRKKMLHRTTNIVERC